MLRIGIINPYYNPAKVDGSAISAKLLSEYLAASGLKVKIFSFDTRTTRAKEKLDGIEVIKSRIPTWRMLPLTLTPYVLALMRRWENQIDIYHVYHVTPLPGAGLYRILGGKRKVIATLNNYAAFCITGSAIHSCEVCGFKQRLLCLFSQHNNLLYRLFVGLYAFVYPVLTRLSQKVDQYIAYREHIKKLYCQFGFPEEKIEVIPNFLDRRIVATKPNPKAKLEKSFDILYAGTLAYHKGTDVLIKAFTKFSSKHANARLYLIGNEKLGYYKNLAKILGVEDRITFTGLIDYENMGAYYSIADIYVHPCRHPEPFNRTLLESLSFNVPLIVSDVPGLPELADNAIISFKKENIVDLIDKLELVYSNRALLQQLRGQCRKSLERYLPENVIPKIINLYKRIAR